MQLELTTRKMSMASNLMQTCALSILNEMELLGIDIELLTVKKKKALTT